MADRTNQYYAAIDAINGFGAQLMVGDNASPETFQAIALISKITPGEMTTNVVQRTHLRSPEAHHEKMAGLRDSGPFSVEGIWSPQDESQSNAGGGTGSFTEGGLMWLQRTRAERNFKIVLNDGSPATEWPFRGVVTRFKPGDITGDAPIMFSADITPLQDYSAELP